MFRSFRHSTGRAFCYLLLNDYDCFSFNHLCSTVSGTNECKGFPMGTMSSLRVCSWLDVLLHNMLHA